MSALAARVPGDDRSPASSAPIKYLGEKQAILEVSPGVEMTIDKRAISPQAVEDEFEYADDDAEAADADADVADACQRPTRPSRGRRRPDAAPSRRPAPDRRPTTTDARRRGAHLGQPRNHRRTEPS